MNPTFFSRLGYHFLKHITIYECLRKDQLLKLILMFIIYVLKLNCILNVNVLLRFFYLSNIVPKFCCSRDANVSYIGMTT